MPREEADRLGARTLPDKALYGIGTLRGAENFDVSGQKLAHFPDYLASLARIKLAATRANAELGVIDLMKADAIGAACVEIIDGQHHENFIVDMFEGSGGTSTNMNMNEVLANRALQIMGHPAGSYDKLHPNDHVNAGQSTNDVIPAAIKLTVLTKSPALVDSIGQLASAFHAKSQEFAFVLKTGRTCMQAAQPMTLGQEFSGYSTGLFRAQAKVRDVAHDLRFLSLGGTAIGTGLGTAPGFRRSVYKHLSDITDISFRPAGNCFDSMQNADGLARVSTEYRTTSALIGKISQDLIILSSGSGSGIGEVQLPAVQAGSSIMPGKVNPVLPMLMHQIAISIQGNDAAVSLAALSGLLEINHFEPIMALRLFETMDLLTNGSRLLAEKCVSGLRANEEQALKNLMASSALATALVPELGYDKTTEIAHQAEAQGERFVDAIVRQDFMEDQDIDAAVRSAIGIAKPEGR